MVRQEETAVAFILANQKWAMMTHTVPWRGLGVGTVQELFPVDSLHVAPHSKGAAAWEHPRQPSWPQNQGLHDAQLKVWTLTVKPAALSSFWFPCFGFPLPCFAPPNTAGPWGVPLHGGMLWTLWLCCGDAVIASCFVSLCPFRARPAALIPWTRPNAQATPNPCQEALAAEHGRAGCRPGLLPGQKSWGSWHCCGFRGGSCHLLPPLMAHLPASLLRLFSGLPFKVSSKSHHATFYLPEHPNPCRIPVGWLLVIHPLGWCRCIRVPKRVEGNKIFCAMHC